MLEGDRSGLIPLSGSQGLKGKWDEWLYGGVDHRGSWYYCQELFIENGFRILFDSHFSVTGLIERK